MIPQPADWHTARWCDCHAYVLGSISDVREVDGMAHGSVSCVERSEVGL